MAVTIKDVARVAGVSHTTVSRALRDSPTISPQTTLAIKRIAAQMGYVPNKAARNLKTSRSSALGVIVTRIDDPFFARVLDGIEDTLHAAGYSLLLAASHQETAREREIVAMFSERRVEGVLICSAQVGEAQRRQLHTFGVQTVLINNQSPDPADHAVEHDDEDGSRILTEHLLALGHTRIAYLGNATAGVTTARRAAGWRAALAAAGRPAAPAWQIDAPNGRPDGGVLAARRLLQLTPRPTAAVCFNDMLAIGALRAIEQAGLQVPHDMAITGFDDIELAAYTTPALTTFHQPKYELGQRAAQMLLHLIERRDASAARPTTVRIQGRLVVRESTAEYSDRPHGGRSQKPV